MLAIVESFDAHEARSMGLVTHVSADVDATVDALTSGILAGAPRAVAETKRLLHTIAGMDRTSAFEEMARLSNELFESAEAAEGMAAFVAKRPPVWRPS